MNRFLSILFILFSGVSLSWGKPNIVFFLADDMGFQDLGCYGADDVPSPSIDQLAATGVKFTNAYAMGAECTPSRTAFLTGQYPQRVKGMECAIGTGNVGRYDDAIELANSGNLGLPADRAVLAPRLKAAGYDTAIFGKWHLGYETHFSPLDQGFDEFFGFLGGNVDYFHHVELSPIHVLLQGREKVERDGYTTDLITADAVDYIRRRSETPGKPFFLYLPHAAPHFPFQGPESDTTLPTKETWLDGDRKTYARMIEVLDDSVKQVIDALTETGELDNTIIAFASDHGAIPPGSNGPYRDLKSTLFEGGIRVPLVVRWPGKLEGGRTYEGVGTLMDLTHSFLRIAGADTSRMDGLDLLKYAETDADMPPREIPWRAKRGERTWKAYRNGPWKYVSKTDGGEFEEWLFNLEEDPYEKNDLKEENSDKIGALKKQLADWEKSM